MLNNYPEDYITIGPEKHPKGITPVRSVGRPPKEYKEPKREVHLYIPDSLAKQADTRRGNIAMSAYILQLIEDDIKRQNV